MNIKNLLTDEDAVSPVIGVILMVAITVILAAVIGAFVLGIGGSQEVAPSASLSFSYDDGATSGSWGDTEAESVTIEHDGGESIAASTLSFKVGGTDVGSVANVGLTSPPSSWEAGGTAKLESGSGSAGAWSSGDTVSVVWSSQESDKTSVLGSGDLP